MKRIYIKPCLKITELQLAKIISTSNVQYSETPAAVKSDTGYTMDDKDDEDVFDDLW